MNHLHRFLALLACASLPALAVPPSIHGEPAIVPKAAPAAKLRLQVSPPIVSLAPVSDAELFRVQQANRTRQKRVAIGLVRDADVVRNLPAAPLVWHSVAGGYAAQAAVRSPDARALRLAIDLTGVREDMTMVFFGSDAPAHLEGPVRVGDVLDRTMAYWSPITDGDTQTVEFFMPAGVDAAEAPRLVGASHLYTTIASGLKATGLGQAETCEIDVKCSSLISDAAFDKMRNSIARMVFNKNGTTFLCTGQVLNDTDPSSQLPWFISGNHCFENTSLPLASSSEMQTVASSLTTLWFFEAVTCSVPSDLTNPPSVQVSGGAKFIYNDPGDDTLLLRLNGTPPAGSFYAGWNAAAIPVGAQVVVVHHPEGDVKKVAQGHVIAYSAAQPDPVGGASTPFSEVMYFSGTTEKGSSGSGLFTFDGTEYQLRGTLYGGGADCSALSATDWYSRFDQAYPALAQYLSPAGTNVDYSDQWFNPAESGWGLNIVEHASQNIFAVWFVFDANGKPTWYTLPGGGWTGPTTFAGTLFATTGPPASGASFNASAVRTRDVGSATISFTDASHATFSYTIDGVTGQKSITRQPF